MEPQCHRIYRLGIYGPPGLRLVRKFHKHISKYLMRLYIYSHNLLYTYLENQHGFTREITIKNIRELNYSNTTCQDTAEVISAFELRQGHSSTMDSNAMLLYNSSHGPKL